MLSHYEFNFCFTFLRTNDTESLFLCLFAIRMSSVKRLFKSFAHFSLIKLLSLSYKRLLFFGKKFLYQKFYNFFSLSVWPALCLVFFSRDVSNFNEI